MNETNSRRRCRNRWAEPFRNGVAATFIIVVACCKITTVSAQPASHRPASSASAAAFLKKHCYRCHGVDKQEADLRLDSIDMSFADNSSTDVWVEVLDRINLGEMPPTDEPQPLAAELATATEWITGQLETIRHRAVSSGGRVLMRRMTRTEYTNTIRDLLAVTFEEGQGPEDLLPPDGAISGFNKVSKALLLDPSLMEHYFNVAERVADRAIRIRQPLVPQRTMRFECEDIVKAMGIDYQARDRAMDVTDDGVLLYYERIRTGYELKHPFSGTAVPITGRYIIRVKAAADRAQRDEPIYMDFTRGQQGRLQRFRVDAAMTEPQIYEFEGTLDATIGGEIAVVFANGTNPVIHDPLPGVDRVNSTATDPAEIKSNLRKQARYVAEGYGQYGNRPNMELLHREKAPKLYLDYIELEGPLDGEWPPRSMAIVFPDGLTKENQTPEYARKIFERLLPRAYRRPVTPDELAAIVGVVQRELEMGNPFHESVKVGVVATLCSPQFLYLLEGERALGVGQFASGKASAGSASYRSAPTALRPLSQYELASRLSYFLWSSMPDEELTSVADAGRLTDAATLNAQIDRMLKHEKANALVDDFASQWLRISEFDRFSPDKSIFPDIYELDISGVGTDMKAEPLEMFREILRHDESVLNFLNSDWTMMNARLARFYGVPKVDGSEFQRVNFSQLKKEGEPAGVRGGLIGMAGVHKWGSDGIRTKPVERGKYILDVLFNDHPPPPPPNAGEVQPNVRGENLTIRERLEQHREIAACANCHRRIDPYGLSLENFNAIGQWRTEQDGEKPPSHWHQRRPLEISGTLPNGDTYAGLTQFRELMDKQSDRFLKGLAEKLFIYALGRPIEGSDKPAVDDIVASAKDAKYTLRSMIKAVAASRAFQTK